MRHGTTVNTYEDRAEALCCLNAGYFSITVVGTTAIQTKLMNLKRPTSINESGAMLVEVRRLLMELARQSGGEKVTSATIKAAYETLADAYMMRTISSLLSARPADYFVKDYLLLVVIVVILRVGRKDSWCSPGRTRTTRSRGRW